MNKKVFALAPVTVALAAPVLLAASVLGGHGPARPDMVSPSSQPIAVAVAPARNATGWDGPSAVPAACRNAIEYSGCTSSPATPSRLVAVVTPGGVCWCAQPAASDPDGLIDPGGSPVSGIPA